MTAIVKNHSGAVALFSFKKLLIFGCSVLNAKPNFNFIIKRNRPSIIENYYNTLI